MSDFQPWKPRTIAPLPSRRPEPGEILQEGSREYFAVAHRLVAVREVTAAAERRRQAAVDALAPLRDRLLGPSARLCDVSDDLLNERNTGYVRVYGATAIMPTSDGSLVHAPLVSLTSPNPANTLAHEAMHALLRSGRVTLREFDAWTEETVEKACERYKLRDSYDERWLREEAITHVSAEWCGGEWDSEVGHFPAKIAAARKSLVQSLSMTVRQVAFLDAFDTGEIGQRPLIPEVETEVAKGSVTLNHVLRYPVAFKVEVENLAKYTPRPLALGPKADRNAVRPALGALPVADFDRLHAATAIAADRLPRGIRAYRPSVIRTRRALEVGSELLAEARRERGLLPLVVKSAFGKASGTHRGDHHGR
jgi:hypothetical protein